MAKARLKDKAKVEALKMELEKMNKTLDEAKLQLVQVVKL